MGRTVAPTVAVAGDCKGALRALLPLIDRCAAASAARTEWVARCTERKRQFPFAYVPASNGRVKTQQVIEALYKGLQPQEEKMIVSTGVGNHQMMACQFIRQAPDPWACPARLAAAIVRAARQRLTSAESPVSQTDAPGADAATLLSLT